MSQAKWITSSVVFQFSYVSPCVDFWQTQSQNRPQVIRQLFILQMVSLSALQPLLRAVQRRWTLAVSATLRSSLWTPHRLLPRAVKSLWTPPVLAPRRLLLWTSQKPPLWPRPRFLLRSLKHPLQPPLNQWTLQRVTYTCPVIFMYRKLPHELKLLANLHLGLLCNSLLFFQIIIVPKSLCLKQATPNYWLS